MKEEVNKKKLSITLCIAIAVSFFLEMFIFNNHLYFESKFAKEEILPLQSASLSECSYNVYNGITVWKDKEKPPKIEIDSTVKAVSITIKTELLEDIEDNKLGLISGKISISDDANQESAIHIQDLSISPGTERSFRCESGGTLHTVTLDLNKFNMDYAITDIIVNSHSIPLRFSLLRFLSVILIIYGFYLNRVLQWNKCIYDPSNIKHNIFLMVGCACCIIFVIFLSHYTMNERKNNLYLKLYNSFKQGNTYLEVAKPELVDLGDDIMDYSVRAKKKAPFTFDTAYYNGHIYSYFGLAPIPYYYAFEAIHHRLPKDTEVMRFFGIIFIIFSWLSIREVVKVFRFKVNLLFYLLANIAVVFGSFSFLLISYASFYTMPAICGAVGTVASIFFSYHAYCSKSSIGRRISFGFAGFSFAYILASRPNVCLIALALNAPLYISVLFEKERKIAKKFIDAASFAVPALAFASIIFYYNYQRFGSIFDFGVWHQLTVYDTTYYKFRLTLHNIYYGIYHYFLQLPALKPQFPFIDFIGNAKEGKYLYFSYDYSGVFVIPLNWIWISLPFLYKKKYQCRITINEKTTLAKSVIAATTIATIILALFNYCMAGINLRYIIDINIGVLMVSILLAFAMQPKLKPGSNCYRLACLLCVASIFVGILFSFKNWDCNWRNFSSKSYLEVYDFFMGITE